MIKELIMHVVITQMALKLLQLLPLCSELS